MGKRLKMPGFDHSKKLALELKVSMDELISDEACRIFRLIMESGNQKNKERKKITRISKEDIEFYTDCRCG